jgi:hypothetical protein
MGFIIQIASIGSFRMVIRRRSRSERGVGFEITNPAKGLRPAFLFSNLRFRITQNKLFLISRALTPLTRSVKEEKEGGKAEVRAN